MDRRLDRQLYTCVEQGPANSSKYPLLCDREAKGNATVNIFFSFFLSFLDASTHLYKRLCPSVGQAFLKHRGNEDFKAIKHQ